MLNWIVWNRTDYLYKMDLALDNQQILICHKHNQPPHTHTHAFIYTHVCVWFVNEWFVGKIIFERVRAFVRTGFNAFKIGNLFFSLSKMVLIVGHSSRLCWLLSICPCVFSSSLLEPRWKENSALKMLVNACVTRLAQRYVFRRDSHGA